MLDVDGIQLIPSKKGTKDWGNYASGSVMLNVEPLKIEGLLLHMVMIDLLQVEIMELVVLTIKP